MIIFALDLIRTKEYCGCAIFSRIFLQSERRRRRVIVAEAALPRNSLRKDTTIGGSSFWRGATMSSDDRIPWCEGKSTLSITRPLTPTATFQCLQLQVYMEWLAFRCSIGSCCVNALTLTILYRCAICHAGWDGNLPMKRQYVWLNHWPEIYHVHGVVHAFGSPHLG